MKENWMNNEGSPYPLGVSFKEDTQSFNFAVYSTYAAKVQLLIYKEQDLVNPVMTYEFNPYQNKSHRIWHCRVSKSDIKDGLFYAYKVDGGPSVPIEAFQAFRPNKVLLDPYAKEVFFPANYSRLAAVGDVANDGKAPLGVLPIDTTEFDWQNDQKPIHDHDLVIYETHVRQFTKNDNAGVPSNEQGTYKGLIQKIPHLKELGITAVELMPIHQWDPAEGSGWGYMTLNFFAPHQQYASDQSIGGAINEFKTLVRELHKNDIEVILDVVYNHTTEGDQNGPTYSFKGFDNDCYYMASKGEDGKYYYANYTGVGNTVNCSNMASRQLIIDSLRYWVQEMHVDGFRFDLASIFTRNVDGAYNFDAPIFAEIAADPILEGVVLIAEPWEPGAYLLGESFPGLRWRQWNGKYRDQVKQFIKGDDALASPALSRLYGSDDLFPGDVFNANHGFQSLNYLSSHDGYTLYDCVSYSDDNGQAQSNSSWNCGFEGVENVPAEVMKLRKRLIKNHITFLMVSNGTPMFRAGDEFLQTQYGNGNPYNVDDATTWMDWSRKIQFPDIFNFFKRMIAFRAAHPSIGRSRFWRSDVQWFGPAGNMDYGSEVKTFAFYLKGQNAEQHIDDKDIYVMINSYWKAVEFTFQVAAGDWFRVVNTGLDAPNDIIDENQEKISGSQYLIGPRSIAVFVKEN